MEFIPKVLQLQFLFVVWNVETEKNMKIFGILNSDFQQFYSPYSTQCGNVKFSERKYIKEMKILSELQKTVESWRIMKKVRERKSSQFSIIAESNFSFSILLFSFWLLASLFRSTFLFHFHWQNSKIVFPKNLKSNLGDKWLYIIHRSFPLWAVTVHCCGTHSLTSSFLPYNFRSHRVVLFVAVIVVTAHPTTLLNFPLFFLIQSAGESFHTSSNEII